MWVSEFWRFLLRPCCGGVSCRNYFLSALTNQARTQKEECIYVTEQDVNVSDILLHWTVTSASLASSVIWGGVTPMFVCVCWFVIRITQKNAARISTKLGRSTSLGPEQSPLTFCVDLDKGTDFQFILSFFNITSSLASLGIINLDETNFCK